MCPELHCLSHVTPEIRANPDPRARMNAAPDTRKRGLESLVHDEDGTILGAVGRSEGLAALEDARARFARMFGSEPADVQPGMEIKELDSKGEPARITVMLNDGRIMTEGIGEAARCLNSAARQFIKQLEFNITPELYLQTVERDGWTVKLTRDGRRFEYGLFSRWENSSVLVSIDPQLDEEANVFLYGCESKAPFICLALLISIHDDESEPPAVFKRAPGHVHDWDTISDHYPDAPCDCYVRDVHGRLGAATRVGGKWRVYAGNADASALTHWAWMEPAEEVPGS